MVWDKDDESAIKATPGTMKISWGDPRPPPSTPVRLFFALAPGPNSGLEEEVRRLRGLGAELVGDRAHGEIRWMRDSGGYEFCLGSQL